MSIPSSSAPALAWSRLRRLPSMWLVVLGRMSIIGPRPIPLAEVEKYEPWIGLLTAMKPGFIGPWWLADQGLPQQLADEMAADVRYARAYTFSIDLNILRRVTIAVVGHWFTVPFGRPSAPARGSVRAGGTSEKPLQDSAGGSDRHQID